MTNSSQRSKAVSWVQVLHMFSGQLMTIHKLAVHRLPLCLAPMVVCSVRRNYLRYTRQQLEATTKSLPVTHRDYQEPIEVRRPLDGTTICAFVAASNLSCQPHLFLGLCPYHCRKCNIDRRMGRAGQILSSRFSPEVYFKPFR
jgi:hypothetical protein